MYREDASINTFSIMLAVLFVEIWPMGILTITTLNPF
jgi:hypothetical protein